MTAALEIAVQDAAGAHAAIAAGADRLELCQALAVGGLTPSIALIARGEVQIMAGGGIRVVDIPAFVATGVDAVHLSARTLAGTDVPAGPGGGSAGHDATDPQQVAAAAAAVAGTLNG